MYTVIKLVYAICLASNVDMCSHFEFAAAVFTTESAQRAAMFDQGSAVGNFSLGARYPVQVEQANSCMHQYSVFYTSTSPSSTLTSCHYMHRVRQSLGHLHPQPTAATTMAPPAKKPLINTTQPWKKLEQHQQQTDKQHLRDLLKDSGRNSQLTAEYDNIYMDWSRQRVTPETMKLLVELAKEADVNGKSKHDMRCPVMHRNRRASQPHTLSASFAANTG